MKQVRLTVNGESVEAAVEPRTHLADFLRGQLGLTATHLGCEHGVCGACTVMIDGQPARSCITYAVACEGAEVRTLEGFEGDPVMEQLREAFSEHHALQCGYCTPGMLISARDVVGRLPGADAARVRVEMSGNLCRCTGYVGIVEAVRSVAARGDAPPPAASAPAAPVPGSFTLTQAPAPSAPAQSAPATGPSNEGWSSLAESFVVPHPPAEVWRLFEDVRAVAACMPGAELTEVEGERLAGRLTVKFGPIRAAFAGEATQQRDPATRSGTIRGGGTDKGSGSRASGEVRYRLEEEGADGTRVSVEVLYQLGGSLAQFGRGGLVRDFAARLTADFARNLSARLSGEAPPMGAGQGSGEINAVSLFFSIVWRRLRALFGR